MSEPVNSFAVISFNIRNPQETLRYEHLDLSPAPTEPMSLPLSFGSRSISPEAVDVVEEFHTEEDEEFRYRCTDYNYWIINDGEEFIVSSMPANVGFIDADGLFCGPFISEFFARKFINEMKDYLNLDGI